MIASKLKAFCQDQTGAAAIEYGLIAALIGVALIAALVGIQQGWVTLAANIVGGLN